MLPYIACLPDTVILRHLKMAASHFFKFLFLDRLEFCIKHDTYRRDGPLYDRSQLGYNKSCTDFFKK